MLDLAERDCLERFPAADSQSRGREWFAAERGRVESLLAEYAAGGLCDLYARWMRAHLGDATPVRLASELLAMGEDEAQVALLEVFTRQYERAAGLYNQAVREAEVGLHDLRTGDGELPFFAVFSHGGHAVRATCHLAGGRLRIADREFDLLPGGGLPVEALRGAGVGCLTGKAALLTLQARIGSGGRPLALPHLGSSYLPASQRLAVLLKAAGLLPADLAPVVRVRLRLLDRLRGLDAPIRLPGHLARAMGREEVPARALGENWADLAATAARRLDALKTEEGRDAWRREHHDETVREIDVLDAGKRRAAEADPKDPRVRDLWSRVKELQGGMLSSLLRQISDDWQTSRIGYYDSRGAILPWCVALGGEELYNRIIAAAEITEEHA
jgi:hypothetical protein